jgi:hypothetical protein
MIPAATGMTGVHQLFPVSMDLANFFCLDWPGNAVLLISPPMKLGMSGMSHQHLATGF